MKFDIRKIAEALGFTDGAAHGSGACSSEVIDGHWGELTFSANLKEKKTHLCLLGLMLPHINALLKNMIH